MKIFKKPDQIRIMEDHDKAYFAWQELGVKGRTLVHIDAHLDCGWLPEVDLDEIAVNTKAELDDLLADQPLWNPFLKKKGKLLHIGNYIFPALRDGLVDKFYWVVPDPSWNDWRGKRNIKKQLEMLFKSKKYPGQAPQWHATYGRGQLLGKELYICPLSFLPAITEPVLLDIDVDFFLTPQIWRDTQPGRFPWLSPDELVAKLAATGISTEILTIAYSVEGGFTPLRFKYLGNELRLLGEHKFNQKEQEISQFKKTAFNCEINGKNKEALVAYQAAFALDDQDPSLYFNISLLYLQEENADYQKARDSYRQAVRLDKTYGSAYNNYGIIYQNLGQRKKAEKEYQKFLKIDEQNSRVLTGLGYCALAKKDYNRSAEYFTKALALKTDNLYAVLGQGIVYFRQNRISEARELFLSLREKDQDNEKVYWWLGKIAEREKNIPLAMDLYKQAVMYGGDGPLVHLLLMKLCLREKRYWRAAEELKRFIAVIKKGYLW